MQTKKQSLLEAITNTAVGFAISLVSTFIIFPIVGINSSGLQNILVVLFFTAISIARSYVIRRFFNDKTTPIEELVLEARLNIALKEIKRLENNKTS